MTRQLFDQDLEHSSCGVGFITNKKSIQTHELLEHAHEALCKIPHRGGMSAEGVGDGAGVNIDISLDFYRYLTDIEDLKAGEFGIGNFFFPKDESQHARSEQAIRDILKAHDLKILLWRDVETNPEVLNLAAQKSQLVIHQVIFAKPKLIGSSENSQEHFEKVIHLALKKIEALSLNDESLLGLFPLSMSSKTQVYKGRLNSWEVVPYFKDLTNPEHKIHTLFFHTRFSTNTAPNPLFAQPFRRMAHNGELNTDKKNRLSVAAIAKSRGKELKFPKGQSDSARLDQTLARRMIEDEMAIDKALVAMMPPAWENDPNYSKQNNPKVRAMLEYFSLSEEKNDGPAAIIFFDGTKVGARLDRLGLRPLRSVETHDYFAVMSEAGQIDFDPSTVVGRGRIKAGGMVMFDHESQQILRSDEILEKLANEQNYQQLLDEAKIDIDELPELKQSDYAIPTDLSLSARHVAYSLNQESFRFFLDPMMAEAKEKVSAMGFGLAPAGIEPNEGGMSRYFSQRFAQVTNPSLDSIREADGMTLRVALGAKPNFSNGTTKQLVVESPILQPQQLMQIKALGDDKAIGVKTLDALYVPSEDETKNQENLKAAVASVCEQVAQLADPKNQPSGNPYGIIVLSDVNISKQHAPIPAILLVSAVNQHLIAKGLRFYTNIIMETGQAVSTHDIACILGFGASAVCPVTVYSRALELYQQPDAVAKALNNYQKAVEKALMKTMGKFGLCTVESYIGGEFFESNFLDTKDEYLAKIFPNIRSPLGGAGFTEIAKSATDWHNKIKEVQTEEQIPLLGLFKERADGSGHGFGVTAVREFSAMTEEDFSYTDELIKNEEATLLPNDTSYKDLGYEKRTPEQIDKHIITPAYRHFAKEIYAERDERPATLRDVLALPFDANNAKTADDFVTLFKKYSSKGNNNLSVQGLTITANSGHKSDNGKELGQTDYQLRLANKNYDAFAQAAKHVFGSQITAKVDEKGISISATGDAANFFALLQTSNQAISLDEVQPAHQITKVFSTGAMSHGALVERAHQAVAHGANIAGALSNSGEGGEKSYRYNSIKASKIKQFASGRFGVWTGYVADPSLEEIEIKIGQGAKPGEGGQLPAKKVNVEIAAARSGTPGVELVSPPPHHDTYSIEDLAQLIHDAKCARVRVIVKLVSSEGVGTIAVGVAKAGADVINIAGNTGGTGAAQVTSLKHSGRVADIGIAEVHQALAENGLRDKVVLRCSNAHQTGLDVIKSAILGGDSFEFGTTALMMLKCVMAKNCNVKCPAGLTTNPELYEGDPRALAQYFINLAHEVRELLAKLGYRSLDEIRGQTHLLNLINHSEMVGQIDATGLLRQVDVVKIDKPIYLEANFEVDDYYYNRFMHKLINGKARKINIKGPKLNNRNKTVGGQFSVDVERLLNYTLTDEQVAEQPAIKVLANGRRVLEEDSVTIYTHNAGGQSFGAFNTSGITLINKGVVNDGVGKALTGGCIVIKSPGFARHWDSVSADRNVVVGNFALFGAVGGELYVEGQAGDRFGVRNSGAVAVVEGVGDFCCEYMTNGSIVNLGSYGKGFGNGMSGGTAYQYDPTGEIVNRCSKDSVVALPLADKVRLARAQEYALIEHLQEHLRRTGSEVTQKILSDWDNSRQDFYYFIPVALMNHHRSENIAKLIARKQMIEELAVAFAKNQTNRLVAAFDEHEKSGMPLFGGMIPSIGDTHSELMSQYINVTGVWHRACEHSQKALGIETTPVDVGNLKWQADNDKINEGAIKLLRTQERKLMDNLYKDVREAIADYSDNALASLLANKRVEDYKEARSKREVTESKAYGTEVWIDECDHVNAKELAEFESLEQQLAVHYLKFILGKMAEETV
ncbi:MAG: glutamate synthase large subunit [Gammaproteobacteria bacterium]|nr:MAG: glutamate synthase large subunit [Gammaproteobacteria bacterium]